MKYAIGLGSNQGDRLGHLRFALSRLGASNHVVAVSSLYETEPVGGPEQDPFLNAVVIVESDLAPDSLLTELHEIEAAAGRERRERWGPRTLDLDLVATDGAAFDTEDLKIPHPRASEREFVLRPLAEVWPDADVGQATASAALETLVDQGVDHLRTNWEDDSDRWVGWLLVAVQMAFFIAIALSFAADGSLPEGSVRFSHVVGAGIAFVGIFLAFWASRRLGPAMTAVPEPVEGTALVETGPYAVARHPIYGGISLFLAGTSLFLDSLLGLGLTLGLGAFFVMKSIYEERRLRVAHPGYQAYQSRVRHRLVPFLF